MAHAENTLTIQALIAEVFAFVADGMNNPLWRPGVLEIQQQGEGKPGKGTKYHQVMSGPLGKTIPADYEITEYRENEKLAFQVIAGPARPSGLYLFTEKAGATEITFSLDFTPRGLAILMGPMIQKQMNIEVAQLAGLKSQLEKK